MPASEAFGLFGCGLFGLAAVATLIPLRRVPLRARYAVMLAAAFAVFIPFGDRERQVLYQLLALAAVFLYPFALGWTPFDPYSLGYGSIAFHTALLCIALAAWWARLHAVVFIVVAAALAYLAGAYESRNLWDYLIDPLVCAYALARLLANLRHRPPNDLTKTVPAG